MWKEFYTVKDINDALNLLSRNGHQSRIIAGGTDLLLEMERGVRDEVEILVDISRVRNLEEITLDQQGIVHIGPMVTHNHLIASPIIKNTGKLLAEAAWQVGSPQIRNRGTVVGNLVTASPANDTIPPLIALNAKLMLRSLEGERILDLKEFYKGVRKTDLQPGELVMEIFFDASNHHSTGSFYKLGLRNAQAISVVNAAIWLEMDGQTVSLARITLGAVAPVVIRANEAEHFLQGKKLSRDVIFSVSELAARDAAPISDIRGSLEYRHEMIKVAVKRSLESILNKKSTVPSSPVFLWEDNGKTGNDFTETTHHSAGTPINTNINGQSYEFRTGQNKTLLRLIREEAGLTGTKEGCAEGECGACTVLLDGRAVMSCLVPAPRAHNANIITIEGLSDGQNLHRLQSAFIEAGAVQCGYCTPGFLISAAALLKEKNTPSKDEIIQAFTGNLCRCTGYYKIIEAVEKAAKHPCIRNEQP